MLLPSPSSTPTFVRLLVLFGIIWNIRTAIKYETALLELPKDLSDTIIAKAKSQFGSRVIIPAFQEHGEPVDPQSLPAIHSRQSIRIDWKHQPLPELKPDKATIVVVCPLIRNFDPVYGNPFKLRANERVIAVNKEGTYSINYLDPGKYHLVSQSANANRFNHGTGSR